MRKKKSEKIEEQIETVEEQIETVEEQAKKPVQKTPEQMLAEDGLSINLPPSQVVLITGLRANGVPFFEVMGKSANLITLAGLVEMVKRNLDSLWNKSAESKATTNNQ